LQVQLGEERTRADLAVQAVAKAEVRLELIPGLQAEVERLKPFEQQAAVLAANLDSTKAAGIELKARLDAALVDASGSHAELERVRILEQSLQAKLEAALREVETLKTGLSETKAELATAREEVKESRVETKEVRAALAQALAQQKAKPE